MSKARAAPRSSCCQVTTTELCKPQVEAENPETTRVTVHVVATWDKRFARISRLTEYEHRMCIFTQILNSCQLVTVYSRLSHGPMKLVAHDFGVLHMCLSKAA